jgi:uridine kinase
VNDSLSIPEAPGGAASAGAHPRLIAIAGASGSGKTYLASHIAEALGAPVLSLDAYYLDLGHLTLEERAQWNFDHPDALDWPLLRAQLTALVAGAAVDVPTYDFSTHTRAVQTRRLEPAEYLVIEGIFALHDEAVRALLTLGIFVDYRDSGCLDRRMARDVAERGRTPSCVLAQYTKTVRPMFLEFIEPTRAFADLVIRGDSPVEASLGRVEAALAAR